MRLVSLFQSARTFGALPCRHHHSSQTSNSLRLGHNSTFISRPTPLHRRHYHQQHNAAADFPADSQGEASSPPPSQSSGSSWMDMPETNAPLDVPVEVFPRMKEKDPFKLLGIDIDASYEEICEAARYLKEQYSLHRPSVEAIELAEDKILKDSFKDRLQHGFRPIKKGGAKGRADGSKKSLVQRFVDIFEPTVSNTQIINDGAIFVALGIWAAWGYAVSDPAIPTAIAIAYCIYKFYDKRNKRDPEGPHWGGSPIWGAVGATFLSLFLSFGVSMMVSVTVPLPEPIAGAVATFFLIPTFLGLAALYVK